MKFDIAALGELLIDFTPSGRDDAGDEMFARKAGGAPVNLLAAVAACGGQPAFIGKVGSDLFGAFLRRTLKSCGIYDGTVCDAEHNTTLAFVSLDENGDRDFAFYRNFGADVFLTKEEVDADIIANSTFFHFGSLSLTSEPVRGATEYALEIAKNSGCTVTYDPNYRERLWQNEKNAVSLMKKHLDKVDILKISKDELFLLFGENEENAVRKLRDIGVKLILVTDGANGAAAYLGDECVRLPAADVHVVDTTGAGDIFFGTFLGQMIKHGETPEALTVEKATEYLKNAIFASGKSTETRGGIASIPHLDNI